MTEPNAPSPPAAETPPGPGAPPERLRPPVAAVAWSWGVPVTRPSERLVLAGLALHADRHGTTIVGQRRLARLCALSERTVRSALRALAERGAIGRIARTTPAGGRTTDAVVLLGWPEREAIPAGGHPRWGRRVAETLESRLARAAAELRQPLPPPPAAAAGREQDSLNPSLLRIEDGELAAALDALGPWATAENRALLGADRAVLAEWKGGGLDIGRDLLPLLARRGGSGRPAPQLRSWRYFEQAVAPLLAAGREADRPGPAGAPHRATVELLRALVKAPPVRRPSRGVG